MIDSELELQTDIPRAKVSTQEAKQANAYLSDAPEVPVIIIKPSHGWVSLKLGELWAYKELLYFLTWRDIKVRYKQTILGGAWAIIQPLFSMFIFSFIFGKLAKIQPDNNLPYPIWNYAALVPWLFFANGLTQAANSLVGSANLIKKVYFPRLAVPTATILSGVVDFLLAFSVLIGMMFWFGVMPNGNIIWLPLYLLLAIVASLGVGLWLAAMNVQFRDVRYVVPFLVQVWMYASPIVYPSSLIQKQLGEFWVTLYGLNPMVGVVEGFRWALLGTDGPLASTLVASTVAAVALLVSGAFYFRRMEKTFADVV